MKFKARGSELHAGHDKCLGCNLCVYFIDGLVSIFYWEPDVINSKHICPSRPCLSSTVGEWAVVKGQVLDEMSPRLAFRKLYTDQLHFKCPKPSSWVPWITMQTLLDSDHRSPRHTMKNPSAWHVPGCLLILDKMALMMNLGYRF